MLSDPAGIEWIICRILYRKLKTTLEIEGPIEQFQEAADKVEEIASIEKIAWPFDGYA